MKRWIILAAPIACLVFASAASATTSGEQVLAKYAAAWDKVNSYTCTIAAREVSGDRVQDRTYAMKFRKPFDTRMDVTGGDDRGGSGVWHGGDTVKGHTGGFFSFVKLNLNIHDPKAVSVRGTTIADANFGALLEHLKSLKGATIDAVADGTLTKINVAVGEPAADNNVTKELMVLGTNDLPIEYDQWEGDTEVKRVTYSDVSLNVDLPDSTFVL
jgi:outer membrane lipoprotein-sorting protein